MGGSISVAFQGEKGAYSDLASRSVFPESTTIPCATFEDVFRAVEDGSANYALIPIDNSIAGRVADIHTLLPNAKARIIGEHFQPIEHKLLGVPGATLENIKTARSHAHALAQCRAFLKKHTITASVAYDTAGAAKEVSEKKDPGVAAIASSLAGELYGLEILAHDIEDTAHNTTRFLIFSLKNENEYAGDDAITSIFVRLKSVPAALYKSIGGFAAHNINLIKLESYLGDRFMTADFYIEAEGNPESEGMKKALEELKFFSSEMRILGTYKAHSYRNAA